MDEVIGQLTKEQYFELRFLMEQADHYETKLKLARHNISGMEREIEMQRLKVALYKQVVKDSENTALEKRKFYSEFKKSLEEAHSLNCEDWSIDDFTYEIKKIG